MASMFNWSKKSSRALSIDDSFHDQQQQHGQWVTGRIDGSSSGRKLVRSSSVSSANTGSSWATGRSSSSSGGGGGKLVRSNSVSSKPARAAGTLPPSTSPASKEKGKGKLGLRSVMEFLSRRSKKAGRPGSFTMTEPASPVSSLSRTNSDSSARSVGLENGSGRIRAGEPGSTARPRVSFDAVVQTVYIEQMKEEEVRGTFYCRREYAAFKKAYRTHRDTSTDWCRGNDVLPCNCDSCKDDLVEGGRHGQPMYSSSAPAPVVVPSNNDNYDSAFDSPPPPPCPLAPGQADKGECGQTRGHQEHADPPPPPSPFARVHKRAGKGREGEGQQGFDGPPSPVDSVFKDTQEDSIGGGGGSSVSSCCSSSSGSSSGSSRRSRTTAPRKCSSSRHSSARRKAAAYRQRGTWGVGSVPIAASPVGRAYKRGGSLDGWGATSGVQEAVKCHGEGYAYKTLRRQGFSDLYIRTHFLPEG